MMMFVLMLFEYIYINSLSLLYKIILPIALFISVYYCDLSLTKEVITLYVNNSVTVLGVLLGFTASIFAIILTSDNKAIQEAKNTKIEKRLYKNPMSLYDELVVSCTLLISMFGFLLIGNFLLPVYKGVLNEYYLFVFSIDLSLIVFSVIQLISSILEFYFLITKRENK